LKPPAPIFLTAKIGQIMGAPEHCSIIDLIIDAKNCLPKEVN